MNKNLILGICILVISILNLLYRLIHFIDLSVLVSILGIVSYILQIKKRHVYKTLQLIWIVAQLPLITVPQDFGNTVNEKVIFDLAQLYEFPIKFGLQYSSTWYNIGINLIPVIYLAAFKLIVRNEYLNQAVTVIIDNEKSKISEYSPFYAKIVEYEKDWFTARLNKKIEINNSELGLVKFKLKKAGFLNPIKKVNFVKSGWSPPFMGLKFTILDLLNERRTRTTIIHWLRSHNNGTKTLTWPP